MTSPSKPSSLSTVYLDSQRVGLMGDPRPMVAKIVAAAGRAPAALLIARSRTPGAPGKPVQLDDVIDRTVEPTKAIYLTSRPGSPAAAPGNGQPSNMSPIARP